MEEAYNFLALGGPTIIPILFCSVFAMTIFLERLWTLQRHRILPPQFISILQRALRERLWSRAESLCEGNESAFARVALEGIKHRGRERHIVKESLEAAGQREVSRMERYIGALGAIASVTPLIGLLGTVLGMIGVFKTIVEDMEMAGEVNPASLAGGIWEALMSTAAGLSVAIPAFLMFQYLMSRVDRSVVEMEEQIFSMVDDIAALPLAGTLSLADSLLMPQNPSLSVKVVDDASLETSSDATKQAPDDEEVS